MLQTVSNVTVDIPPVNMSKVAAMFCLLSCVCGELIVDNVRIIGGSTIDISEAPYQLAMQISRSGYWTFFCAASLISSDTALSAAHCVSSVDPSALRLRAGSSNRNSGGSLSYLSSTDVHPNYNSETLQNDISILHLKSPLAFTNTISPISLPSAGYSPKDGDIGFISGWGVTAVDGTSPSALHGASVPLISFARCSRLYLITEDMLCAGVVDVGGIDACSGDSGGPLAVNNTLVGIVSWGDSCALARKPGVYANVAYFRNWIALNTGI